MTQGLFKGYTNVVRLCQRCIVVHFTPHAIICSNSTRGAYHRYRYFNSKTHNCSEILECPTFESQPACCLSIFDQEDEVCVETARSRKLRRFSKYCFDSNPWKCSFWPEPTLTAGIFMECNSWEVAVLEFQIYCIDDKIDEHYYLFENLTTRHLYNSLYPNSSYESFANTNLSCSVLITSPVTYEVFVMNGGDGDCVGIQLRSDDGTDLYPTNRTTCNYDLTSDTVTIDKNFTLNLFTNDTLATGVNATVLVVLSSKDNFTIWCLGYPITTTVPTTTVPTTTTGPTTTAPSTTTGPTTLPPTTPPPTTTTTPQPSPSTTPSETAPTKEEGGGSMGIIIGAVVGVVAVAGAGVGGFFLLKMLKKPVIPSPTVSPAAKSK
ncbi:uncharacterized protein LOC126808916 [Patella vulgata]|uniref:uncharacterized protein LOC126808916 n=1 Tax=Patella vulgata TaxID=6465 RepID=UPI00217FF217|nr:uncharacterized protein LOC126808916 [Patella vulgata]XP_050389944.1 uncharacterized protein LOC126808916 [Patella vulgata]XP_050389945.1 uncharacterized protein LOC126808916 [Patella vulgata]